MTTFYNTLKLSIFFLLIGIAVSCKDSDGGDPVPALTNAVEYNGKTYNLLDGLIFDYGAFGLGTNNNLTHYNYDFAVVNGEIKQVNGVYDEDNVTAGIWVELYSPGTDSFEPGTFTYMDEKNMTESAIANKYFFKNASFLAVEEQGYTFLYVKGGTVKVSGTANNYTLEYDMVLEDGKPLKGSFSRSLKYNDFK